MRDEISVVKLGQAALSFGRDGQGRGEVGKSWGRGWSAMKGWKEWMRALLSEDNQ